MRRPVSRRPRPCGSRRDPDRVRLHAYGLMVLTLEGEHVAAITGFPDTGVFAAFGLPRTLRQLA
jgi:hypothetical protein